MRLLSALISLAALLATGVASADTLQTTNGLRLSGLRRAGDGRCGGLACRGGVGRDHHGEIDGPAEILVRVQIGLSRHHVMGECRGVLDPANKLLGESRDRFGKMLDDIHKGRVSSRPRLRRWSDALTSRGRHRRSLCGGGHTGGGSAEFLPRACFEAFGWMLYASACSRLSFAQLFF